MEDAILFIDFSSLWWPAYRATAGVDIGAANSAAVNRVRFLAGRYKHVGVACDSGRSFRVDISADYKAHREKDTVARDLIRKAQDRLRDDGFVLWSERGFEADDILATLARQAAAQGQRVVIATADKDLLACVTDRVSLLHTMTDVLYDPAAVEAKLGVPPRLVPAFLALVGDKSDNIPGVRGIGATHAARLLRQFGSMEALTESYAEVKPPSVQAAIERAMADESLAMSIRLVALRTDVPDIDYRDALAPRVVKPIAPSGEDYDMPQQPEDVDAEIDEEPPPDIFTRAAQKQAEATPAPQPAAAAAPQTPPPAEAPKPETKALAQVAEAELLTPDDPRFRAALEPRTSGQAWSMAKAVFNSRLFSNIPNAEAAWLVITMGRSLGLDAVTMLRNIHIIEGRIALHAAVIVGLVIRSGKADYFKLVESTPTKATYKTHRKDDPDPEPTIFSWTIEDANRAQLTGPSRSGKPSNWDKIPRTMLRWRCSTELARAVYPDVVFNLYSPEELGADGALPDEAAAGARAAG